MEKLSSALTVLSAMITPSVLIVASGSLSLTTSQRLSRSIDRVRQVSEQLKELNTEAGDENQQEYRNFLVAELLLASRRCRFMQQAMTSLYLTLGILVATIIVIGVMEVLQLNFAWILLLLGFSGVLLLFHACIMLIMESRLALASVNQEMDYTLAHHLTP